MADVDGPTYRYPDAASPGCWAVYGEVLAREYGEFRYPSAHRLAVDAYAVQHPGMPTPQTVQSVTVHLISLCAVLERGYEAPRVAELMRRAIARYKGRFVWLERPASLGSVTVLDVAQATSLAEHVRCVEGWARAAWTAWSAHHRAIHRWVDRLEARW